MELQQLIWLIPLLPVGGFLVNVFFGSRLPKPVVSFIACGTVLGSAVIAWMAFLDVRHHVHSDSAYRLVSSTIDWIKVPGSNSQGWMQVLVQHKLVVDPLTCVMILVVTNIGFLIHLYSTGYMADEKRYSRYFSYLNLFTGFMLILVMASNALLMFVGWEGVGLCSYLLIGFWFEKTENAAAGMKAFIVNRVGDFCFTIGLLLLFVEVGRHSGVWTVDFAEWKAVLAGQPGLIAPAVLTAVGILMFLGATGKSAQIPLYTWLPDAMAGPTPVSALIHAATMVTAGVYMVARMNFVFAQSPTALTVVAVIGATTALFAGTIGVAQNDIKKVLAYSTVSQLGFMFLGVGVGAFAAGIFHVMTHAFFKACLFLGSGSVIHGMGGEQDIRKMGGLKKYMPVTFWTFLIASLAIAGFPLLAGFWSKDEILWKAWSTTAVNIPGPVLWGMGVIAAGFTAFYMTRLVVLTFFGELRSTPKVHGHGHDDHAAPAAGHGHDAPDAHGGHDAGQAHGDVPAPAAAHGHDEHGHGAVPHESPWTMTVPLVVLMSLSVVGGFIGMPHWIPGGGVFEHWLDPVCPDVTQMRAHGHETADAHASTAPAHGEPAKKDDGHHHGGGHLALEITLMVVSVAVGLGGIFAGLKVYYWGKGKAAEEFVRSHRELYELVRDKYRIDELYESAIIEPVLANNEFWARFDNAVVDGAVNGTARLGAAFANGTGYFDNEVVDGFVNGTGAAVQAAGAAVRRTQTGRIRQYVTGAVVGGLIIMAAFCVVLQWDSIVRLLRGTGG